MGYKSSRQFPVQVHQTWKINNQRERILTHQAGRDLLQHCENSRLNALSDLVKFVIKPELDLMRSKLLKD